MKSNTGWKMGSGASILAAVAIMAGGLLLPGCKPGPEAARTDPASAEQDAKYTCPMHPEVVQDTPGKCPKCGMNLEKQK